MPKDSYQLTTQIDKLYYLSVMKKERVHIDNGF